MVAPALITATAGLAATTKMVQADDNGGIIIKDRINYNPNCEHHCGNNPSSGSDGGSSGSDGGSYYS
jgi:hypothetical protein